MNKLGLIFKQLDTLQKIFPLGCLSLWVPYLKVYLHSHEGSYIRYRQDWGEATDITQTLMNKQQILFIYIIGTVMTSQPPDYTAESLKTQIIHEKIMASSSSTSKSNFGTSTFHYTACKKEAATISILSNLRLLIYSENQQTIYYINYTDTLRCPFRQMQNVPKPKKDYVHIRKCIFKKDPKDPNTIAVTFNLKKGKGQLDCIEWRFVMQSAKLAAEWEKFIIEQKKLIGQQQSQIDSSQSFIKDRGNINQTSYHAIRPLIEDTSPPKQSIKPEQTSEPKDSEIKKPKKEEVVKKNKDESEILSEMRNIDWNMKLIEKYERGTAKQFQRYALLQFGQDMKSDFVKQIVDKCSTTSLKVNKQNVIMYYTLSGSEAAHYFQAEFSNFHYIVKCCKESSTPPIRVPLICLIEWKGILCFIKSRFPPSATILSAGKLHEKSPFMSTIKGLFKQLESLTKIQSSTLIQSSVILNLSKEYELCNGLPRIYIDEVAFLPTYPKIADPHQLFSVTKYSQKQLILGQVIMDNFRRSINTKQEQASREIYYYVQQAIKQLVEYLIWEKKVVYGDQDLRNLMKSYGLTISFLPILIYHIDLLTKKDTLKYLKVLIANMLISDIVMTDHIKPTINAFRRSNQTHLIQSTVESIFRKLVETGTVLSQHFWKQLIAGLNHRYQYKLSIYDVNMGILVTCLIHQIGVVQFDATKFKKIREGEYKVQTGFVISMGIRCESYDQLYHPLENQIMRFCEDTNVDNTEQLRQMQILSEAQNYDVVFSKDNKIKFLHYLSTHLSPFQQSFPELRKLLYSYAIQAPPDLSSYPITVNFLMHHTSQIVESKTDSTYEQKVVDYRRLVTKVQQYFSLWFGNQHIYFSPFLEHLATFHYCCENDIHSCKTILLRLIDISKRNCSSRSPVVGRKLHQLGSILFKCGYLKQAETYLIQALDILEDKNISQTEYGEVAASLAQLSVTLGKNTAAIEFAEKSIKCLQNVLQLKYPLVLPKNKQLECVRLLYNNHKSKLKIYQIEDKRDELQLELIAIDRLMRKESEWVNFQEMTRTCVHGVIERQITQCGSDKIKLLEGLITTIAGIKQEKPEDDESAKKDLMHLTQNSSLPQYMDAAMLNIDLVVSQIQRCKQRNQPLPWQSTEFLHFLRSLLQCTGHTFLLQLF